MFLGIMNRRTNKGKWEGWMPFPPSEGLKQLFPHSLDKFFERLVRSSDFFLTKACVFFNGEKVTESSEVFDLKYVMF